MGREAGRDASGQTTDAPSSKLWSDAVKFSAFNHLFGELHRRQHQVADAVTGLEKAASAQAEAAVLSRAVKECSDFEELRKSPCWPQMAEAFHCYVASSADAKGDECRRAFGQVHKCMLENMEHFRGAVRTDEDLELLKDFRGRVF